MQRKVFRIEQTSPQRRAAPPLHASHAHRSGDSEVQTLRRELAELRDLVGGSMRELAALLAEGKERRMARAAGELGAAVDVMEKATDNILQSAEAIDECAKAVAASQSSDYLRGLMQDIQEHVVRLYEACNFQDLAGQRIGKVIATLDKVEAQVSEVLARSADLGLAGNAPLAAPPRSLLNGPRLDGDDGHASQSEIDAMFG